MKNSCSPSAPQRQSALVHCFNGTEVDNSTCCPCVSQTTQGCCDLLAASTTTVKEKEEQWATGM